MMALRPGGVQLPDALGAILWSLVGAATLVACDRQPPPESVDYIQWARERHGGDWGPHQQSQNSGLVLEWPLYGPNLQWGRHQSTGTWVLHPPIDFVYDLLGPEVTRTCTDALDAGSWSCRVTVPPCLDLTVFASGSVQMDLLAPGCGEASETVDWQIYAAPGPAGPD